MLLEHESSFVNLYYPEAQAVPFLLPYNFLLGLIQIEGHMNNRLLRIVLIAFLAFNCELAIGIPPPPPGSGNATPINMGLMLLATAGLGLGFSKVKKGHKKRV